MRKTQQQFLWHLLPAKYSEFTKKLLKVAKVGVSPGIGFGDYGDKYVRFGLIENEHRTRQAIRGVKEMFKQDGLL
jgi:alanine-synthesizing transaminase